MTPLDQSKPGGVIFPESMYAFVPHILPISATVEEEVSDLPIADGTLQYGMNAEWYERMMDDLSRENPGLQGIIERYRRALTIPDEVWTQFFGEWLYALRQEYHRHDQELPIVCFATLDDFQVRQQLGLDLVPKMISALSRECSTSDSGWCTHLRCTKINPKGRGELIKVLCLVMVLLDFATQEQTDFMTSGTTPRSD